MEISSDPYEQKLYHMFKSYDTEANGSLDEDALIKLCKTLELKEQSHILVKCLLVDDKKDKVTFREFKEGLLKFLGSGMTEITESNDHLTSSHIESDKEQTLPDSGNNSPLREVSPKFVVGTKKYGRRSRPSPHADIDENSLSDSDNENVGEVHDQTTNEKLISTTTKSSKVQRSASQSDLHGMKRRRPGTGSKLKRCASLPAQKHRHEITPRELRPAPTSKLDSSIDSLDDLDFENLSQNFYDIWINIGHKEHNFYLNRDELEIVCKLVGLAKIASKMADEVYDKLNLDYDCRISFSNFIALIQSDTEMMLTSTTTASSSSTTSRNNQRNIKRGGVVIAVDTTVAKHAAKKTTNTPSNHDVDDCDDDGGVVVDGEDDDDEGESGINCNLEDASNASLTAISNNSESTIVPSDVIIDMWESAGIANASNLLTSLGFTSDQIQIVELSTVLDEELHSQNSTEASQILRASVALHKAEVIALRQAITQLGAENRKLYADNKDANRRAAILAQEIDERHASIENTTKSEIKILEQRHAELVREITTQLAAERENCASINGRWEARIKSLEMEDIRLKNELQVVRDDKSALETEQISLQKQLTDLLEDNIKLNNDLAEFEEKFKTDENLKTDLQNEEVLELIEKINSLQVENSNLRDKNDELTAEIEGVTLDLQRIKSKKQQSNQEDTTAAASSSSSDIEQSGCVAMKRRGDSPSKTRVTEESPRLGKFRKCNGDGENTESETSGDWMALNSELCQTGMVTAAPVTANSSTSGFSQDFSSLNETTTSNASRDEELKAVKARLVLLEKELDEFKKNGASADTTDGGKLLADKTKLETQCAELEASLEQMRKEYEDCEDYWQSKLNEERQLYEEEQRMSDEKLNELLRKMSEYEEQFATTSEKDGRLTPIDENSRLEEQFVELEAETEEIKKNARKLLEEKDQEVRDLYGKIKLLELKLIESNSTSATDMIAATSPPPRISTTPLDESPASSPISYLWAQGTIFGPTRDYQNPNWNNRNNQNPGPIGETSTNPWHNSNNTVPGGHLKTIEDQLIGSITRTVSPIQRPNSSRTSECGREVGDHLDGVSVGSGRSVHSVASTYNVNKSPGGGSEFVCQSPNNNTMKEDIKRLKVIEMKLREEVKDLCQQRDHFILEIQQLQEAKPVLEKAYARTAHPSLTSKIQQLEQKNRHLQNSLRQQNQYVETIMHQTWQQQRSEINELRTRLETQNIIITEQSQRLTSADMLVKDLYVENSHLAATIQRMEQQRSRGMMQLQHSQNMNGINGMAGMP